MANGSVVGRRGFLVAREGRAGGGGESDGSAPPPLSRLRMRS